MAAYISFQPSDFFTTKLYTGNASTQVISSIGFNPDFTWIKERDGTNDHKLFDRVRGNDKYIESNTNDTEATESSAFTFGTDQFTLGNYTPINGSGHKMVAWSWGAGTTSGKPTTDETLTPTAYSYNAAAGTSIIAYTGTGSTGLINHGLGVKPELIIVKPLSASDYWLVYQEQVTGVGYVLQLSNNSARTGSSWDCNTTANTFQVNGTSNTGTSQSGVTYIAYAFANIKGYSRSGSYVGNGNANGSFIHTGFRPAYVMVKRWDLADNWFISDNQRPVYADGNPRTDWLYADETNTEVEPYNIDYLSNGFKFRTDHANWNGSGDEYLYMAFAEFPFVSSNSKAGVAR